MDAVFAAFDRTNSPGAAVVVVLDGRVIHARGYGQASLEQARPITPQTVFDVASVAKQFTGLGVAMLAEAGRLSPDDDVRKHLPDVPDFGVPITLAQLVHHTSGLRDWPETLAFSGHSLEAPITIEMIRGMVRRQRDLDFTPGTEHLYSNTGYNLLADIVEKVTGTPFAGWTREHLFLPLGMSQTHFLTDPAEVIPNRADSYGPLENGGWRRIPSDLAAPGSSSLFTTADDLGRWLLSFDTPPGTGGAARDRMHQPGRLKDGQTVNYGHGVGLDAYRRTPRVMHTGCWAGYRSLVLRLPGQRFGVAILGNATTLDVVRLGERLADVCLDTRLQPAPAPSAPSATARAEGPARGADPAGASPAALEAYVGRYWSPETEAVATVTLENGRLMASRALQGRLPLVPLGPDRFAVQGGPTLQFTRTAAGSAVDAVKVSGSRVRNLRFLRVALPEVPP
jgi:CubicO group peptidase (beta-lactamase class C family)